MTEAETAEPDPQQQAYVSYDGFLRLAIEKYWHSKGNRVNFVALLLASREAWGVAAGEIVQPSTGRTLLTGAAATTGVLLLLRAVLGGPVGLLLTGASVASLAALYARNHRLIWAQQERYRALLGQYRIKHMQVRGKLIDGDIDEETRDLMIDGLMNRLLEELDEAPELPDADTDAKDGA
jgi:hypothetical protein